MGRENKRHCFNEWIKIKNDDCKSCGSHRFAFAESHFLRLEINTLIPNHYVNDRHDISHRLRIHFIRDWTVPRKSFVN